MLPEERTTGLGCITEGRTVSYQCTVTDPLDPPVASTVWRGSAFSCPYNWQVVLLHSLFELGVSATCGNLTAMSVGVNAREYTSRLTLKATIELNGQMINCTLAGVVLIGSDTLNVGG